MGNHESYEIKILKRIFNQYLTTFHLIHLLLGSVIITQSINFDWRTLIFTRLLVIFYIAILSDWSNWWYGNTENLRLANKGPMRVSRLLIGAKNCPELVARPIAAEVAWKSVSLTCVVMTGNVVIASGPTELGRVRFIGNPSGLLRV